MKQIVDINTWKRKDNFLFFKDFLNPYLTVTCPVQCAAAKEAAQSEKESFFLYYLYAILEAANAIEEFRYRIDTNDRIVLYDRVDVFTPVRQPGTDAFTTLRIPFREDRKLFFEKARELIHSSDTIDPYSAELNSKEFDVILVSAIPTLPFTSITCTQKNKNGSDYPLINVGKMDENGKMPVAVSVHHGFVDGVHLSEFFSRVEQTLKP